VTDSDGNPVNLSHYSVESLIRKSFTSKTAYPFQASANSSGVVSLSMDANTSNSMDYGRYVYDIIVTDQSGNVTRLIEGQVTLNPSVSR